MTDKKVLNESVGAAFGLFLSFIRSQLSESATVARTDDCKGGFTPEFV